MGERLVRLLAFDCSGASCSAAVMIDGQVAAERFAAMERGQAEVLLPLIQAVMAEAGIGWRQIDAIATTVGPGSFTGVRLGLSAARGLALAANRPILALTAFEALAAGLALDGRTVAIVIDSRRGPVFAQKFGGDRRPRGEPAQVEPADFAAWLGAGGWHVAGDGVGNLVEQAFPADVLLEARVRRIQAGDLARAALALGAAGIGRLPAHPLYLRAPDVSQPKPRP